MHRPRLLLIALLAAGVQAPLRAQSIKVQEKVEDLEARARADSNDPVAHYNLALGYWSKKRYVDADSALQRSVTLDPRFAMGWLALAVVRNWDGHYWDQLDKLNDSVRDAERKSRDDDYRRAFLLDPLVDMRILGATWRLPGNGPLTDGMRELYEGKYPQATTHLTKALDYYGGLKDLPWLADELRFLRAMAAARASQYDIAIEDMHVLIRGHPVAKNDTTREVPLEVPQYRYILASMEQHAGHTELAIQSYQEALVADVGNYMAHVQLAAIYEADRDYPAALKERQRAMDAYPDDPSLMIDMGLTLGKSGQMPEALESFKAAGAAGSHDVRLYFWTGLAQQQLGMTADARASYQKFLAVAPARYDRLIALTHQHMGELPQ